VQYARPICQYALLSESKFHFVSSSLSAEVAAEDAAEDADETDAAEAVPEDVTDAVPEAVEDEPVTEDVETADDPQPETTIAAATAAASIFADTFMSVLLYFWKYDF
jgi:hypothetical protein